MRILDQNLEINQPLPLLTQPSKSVETGALEVKIVTIEAMIMGVADGRTGPVAHRIAVLDAILDLTLLLLAALGGLAFHLLGLWVTGAALCACGVSPELLIGSQEVTLKEAATGSSRDALPSIHHKAILTLARLYTL